MRWAVALTLLTAAIAQARLILTIHAEFGAGNALVLGVLVAPPGLLGAWMATTLILRRSLDEQQSTAVGVSVFRLGLLTAVILGVALAQSRSQAPQGFGVLAATVGGALLWNAFVDIFVLWVRHRRGPAKHPLQKVRRPPPITRAHRFPDARGQRPLRVAGRRVHASGQPRREEN